MSVLIGCDPEIFVRENGKFVSAHGMIPGDKRSPYKVDGGAVQVDGMALEFNINPAATEQQFVGNVQQVLAILGAMVPGKELVATPVADFPLEYIMAQPEEARELGCDPDFNAWNNGEANVKPDANLPMRTASGHVHIGWTNDMDIFDENHRYQGILVAKTMDLFLGVPSLFYDNDQLRRTMYGSPGCLRFKPYGMEYRTLSNAWLKTPERMAWVFRAAQRGMQSLMSGEMLFQDVKDLQKVVASSDMKRAEEIVKQFNLEVVA